MIQSGSELAMCSASASLNSSSQAQGTRCCFSQSRVCRAPGVGCGKFEGLLTSTRQSRRPNSKAVKAGESGMETSLK
ncbi:hypothetical protein D9M70_622380 [compost metagenome]